MKRVFAVVVIALLLRSSSDVFIASLAAMQEEPVAIVCLLSGKGSATFDNKRTELRLFHRLRSGAVVETEAGSRVVLAFFTGDRYEFREKASGTLGRTGFDSSTGEIQKLTPVPAIVDIAPIAREEKPGTRLAAARIRTGAGSGKSISNLYPAEGAAIVAETALLRFDAVEGYQKYKLDLEDETGNAIFSMETATTTVQIPIGVLREGAQYYWRVRTQDAEKPAMRGEAVFSTLNHESATRRAALKAHADASNDLSLLGLLAEFDRSVGLQREACDELRRVLDQGAANPANAEALARFRCSEPDGSPKRK